MSTVGYSGKSLIEKLGLKPGQALAAIDPPEHYADLVAPLPEGARVETAPGPNSAIVHLFVRNRAALEAKAAETARTLPPGASLWVSWPKKASKLHVDLTEDGVRAALLPTGLVDVKVAAVDADWSGLKFLRRKT
jgi:hypothetical protein